MSYICAVHLIVVSIAAKKLKCCQINLPRAIQDVSGAKMYQRLVSISLLCAQQLRSLTYCKSKSGIKKQNPALVFRHCLNMNIGFLILQEANKSVWGMPRLSEAMKDVINCDKPRGLVIRIDPWISEWGNPPLTPVKFKRLARLRVLRTVWINRCL